MSTHNGYSNVTDSLPPSPEDPEAFLTDTSPDTPGRKTLEHLVLFNTKVTPECVPQLIEMKGLKKRYLGNITFSDSDMESLRAALVDTQIEGDLQP